jgi:polyisoprenoid-binding protein YceI
MRRGELSTPGPGCSKLGSVKILPVLFTLLTFSPLAFAKENCSFAPEGEPKLEWRAFKFSEKFAVPGTFRKIEVSKPASAHTLGELIGKISAKIDPASVSTNDPTRDAKVRSAIFAPGPNGADGIRVSFGTLAKDGKEVPAAIEIQGRKLSVPFQVQYDEKSAELKLTGKLSLLDFGMSANIAHLEEICSANHTGKDGVRKLWPDVEITVTSRVERHCAAHQEKPVSQIPSSHPAKKLVVRAPVKARAQCCGGV